MGESRAAKVDEWSQLWNNRLTADRNSTSEIQRSRVYGEHRHVCGAGHRYISEKEGGVEAAA